MKNTIEPNKVKALITFIVVLSVITFSSIGYMIGKGSGDGITTGLTEIEDSSAAVYNNVQKGNVKYTKPQYIPVREAMPLYFKYTGVNNTNDLPDWKINFCGVVKRYPDTQEVATSRRFNTVGSCKITVNVTVNGKTETVVFYQKVLKIKSTVDTELLTNGDAYLGEDYTVGISLDGKVNAAYKGVDWNWSATGDCEAGWSPSIGVDAVLVLKLLNPGVCTVKVVGYVYYDTYAIKAVESAQINILPARVVPTDELEVTEMPTPVPSVVIPTVTPAPSSVGVTPTPASNPAAMSLFPSTFKTSPNGEFKVAIMAQPPNTNITGYVTSYQIRLKVQGASIVEGSFVEAGGNLLTIGTCNTSNSAITTNEVCVDVSTMSGYIPNNQVLGSFTIKAQTTNPIVVSTIPGNAYLSNGQLQLAENIKLASYTVSLP